MPGQRVRCPETVTGSRVFPVNVRPSHWGAGVSGLEDVCELVTYVFSERDHGQATGAREAG